MSLQHSMMIATDVVLMPATACSAQTDAAPTCPATPSTGCTGSPASDAFTVTAPPLLRGDSTGSVAEAATTPPLAERRPFLSLSLPEWAYEIDEDAESPCSSSSFEDLFPSPVASPVASRRLEQQGGAAAFQMPPPPRLRSAVRWADLDESDEPGADDVWNTTVSEGLSTPLHSLLPGAGTSYVPIGALRPRSVCWADLAESEDEADPSGAYDEGIDGKEEGQSPRVSAVKVAADLTRFQGAHRFKGEKISPESCPGGPPPEPASPSESKALEEGTQAPKRTGGTHHNTGAMAPEMEGAIAGPSTSQPRTAGTNTGTGGEGLPHLLARQPAQEPRCRSHTGAGGRPRRARARGRRWSLQGCREAPPAIGRA